MASPVRRISRDSTDAARGVARATPGAAWPLNQTVLRLRPYREDPRRRAADRALRICRPPSQPDSRAAVDFARRAHTPHLIQCRGVSEAHLRRKPSPWPDLGRWPERPLTPRARRVWYTVRT